MDIERDGNLIEAALWFVLGAGLFIYAWLREPHLRATLRMLAVTILFFGGSDLVESRTGAWWKPWWLFVWKAICVLVMTACIVRYYRLSKQTSAPKPDQNMKTILLALCSIVLAAPAQIIYKPVPRMQALPLPHHEISFQRDGVELTRFHFDPADKRPFLYPMNGPSGRSLTRMGHPHDPVTHSHHNSLWLSHHIVNGIDFWGDGPRGHIRVTRIEQLTDDDDAASVTALISWGETNKVLLWERRRITVQALASNEWILTLDTRFDAAREPVTLGKTPFGLAAVRMANSIGVHDGGGMIRNSEGGVNETNIFWKPARWVDYSGAILWQVPTDTNQMRPRIGAIVRDARVPVWEGITFLDHPKNPNHPSHFHVRDDGWMGASLTFSNALVIETNRPLQLRYGFYVHSGLTATNTLNQRWTEFSKTVLPDLTARRR